MNNGWIIYFNEGFFMKKINVQMLFLFSLMNIVAINAYQPCDFVEQELREVSAEIKKAKKKNDAGSENMLINKQSKLLRKSYLCNRIYAEYNVLADKQKEVDIQLSLLYEMENEEWGKLSQKAREKNPTAKTVCVDGNEVTAVLEAKKNEFKSDGRYGQEVCTKLVTAYANSARLAHIHLDDYPQNKNILRERLEMHALGMCENEPWRKEKCISIVTEAHKKLMHALSYEDYVNENITADKQEVLESPEDMYIGIRDLCDSDKSIDWGSKSFILSTVSQGLKKRCILKQQQANGDMSLCDDIPRKLYAMFYKENDSH
jgi:hypothetical protein